MSEGRSSTFPKLAPVLIGRDLADEPVIGEVGEYPVPSRLVPLRTPRSVLVELTMGRKTKGWSHGSGAEAEVVGGSAMVRAYVLLALEPGKAIDVVRRIR